MNSFLRGGVLGSGIVEVVLLLSSVNGHNLSELTSIVCSGWIFREGGVNSLPTYRTVLRRNFGQYIAI